MSVSPYVEKKTFGLRELLAMGERDADADRFVRYASHILSKGQNIDELRLALIRRLVKFGLCRRALAYADGFSERWRQAPEVAQLVDMLRANAEQGAVSWSQLANRFQANIEALEQRGEPTEPILAAWRAHRRHLELHQTRDGFHQVFDRSVGTEGDWRPDFGDQRPTPDVETLRRQVNMQLLAPVILSGVGLGYRLPWLHAATHDTMHGASPVLYLAETSFLGVAVALHVTDWREPLADERVQLCLGESAYERVMELSRADRQNAAPGRLIRGFYWNLADAPRAETTYKSLVEEEHRVQTELRERLNAEYADRGVAYWGRRYERALSGQEAPLRVLGCTSRFTTVLQHSTRHALTAFSELGCETKLLIEESDHASMSPRMRLEAIDAFRPDLILLIDHLRPAQYVSMIDNVPCVSWIQDRLAHLFTPDAGAQLGPLDFCIGVNGAELIARCGYPAERFMDCRIPTCMTSLYPPNVDPERFLAEARGETDERYACDLAFATNRCQPPDELRLPKSLASPTHMPLLHAVYEEATALLRRGALNGGVDMEELLKRVERAQDVQVDEAARTPFVYDGIYPLVDNMIRRETVSWAAEWAEQAGGSFHLYGKGWEDDEQYARYARGYVTHGPELGRAFRAATINLHASCNPAIHQRVLDGLAAGGFFLIREHAIDYKGGLWPRFFKLMRERRFQPGDVIPCDEMPPELRADWMRFNRLRAVDENEPLTLADIHFTAMRRHETGTEPNPLPRYIWPDFLSVVYSSREQFMSMVEHFRNAPEERQTLAAAMRAAVAEHYSYRSLMRRVLAWMTQGMAQAASAG